MNQMYAATIVIGVWCVFSSSPASAQTVAHTMSVAAIKASADKTNAPKSLPAGTTRVAVFNVGVVFNKYERAAAIKEEMAQEMKQLQQEAKELAQDLNAWQAALQKNDLPAAKKEKYEEKIIYGRRRLEDLSRQARTKVGKTQETSLIVLWKDIREAVKTYATEHGIQLVIAYGDPKESEMVDLFPNVTRKMQTLDQGGSMPFFMAPGVDISEALVHLLNRQYREKKAESAEGDDPR
jgi:Skp family chaperone for outer membrane proteins